MTALESPSFDETFVLGTLGESDTRTPERLNTDRLGSRVGASEAYRDMIFRSGVEPLGPEHDEEWAKRFARISDSFRSERYDRRRHHESKRTLYEEYDIDPTEVTWRNSAWSTNRGLHEVAEMHMLSSDDLLALLEGKITLDVGGGFHALHKEIESRGIKAHVINLDLPKAFQWSNKSDQFGLMGSAHEMPLKAECVDVIISTYGAPAQLHSAELVSGYFNELMRVLKVGGMALMNSTTVINGEGDSHFGESYVRVSNIIRSLSSMPELAVFQSGSGGALRIKKLASIRSA